MRYHRTTGLILTQMQELVRRVKEALREPWVKPTGRPKSLGLYQAVEVGCMYLRQNAAQEFIGDMRSTSQPTISRYVAELVPIVKAVLEEFVPSAQEALPLTSGTSAAGCPIRGYVLQVCHDAVCESSRALSATKPLV